MYLFFPPAEQVWPQGKVVFPDYFKNATQQVWKELIVKHRKKLVFDAIWIVSRISSLCVP